MLSLCSAILGYYLSDLHYEPLKGTLLLQYKKQFVVESYIYYLLLSLLNLLPQNI